MSKESTRITEAGFNVFVPAEIMEAPELRISNANEWGNVANLILTAQDKFEEHTGNVLRRSLWELSLDAFPAASPFEIETKAPLIAVESIKYLDAGGAEQTLASSKYVVDQANPHQVGRIYPAYGESWPTTLSQANAVTVQYYAGWEKADDVPSLVKRGLILFMQELYDGDDRGNAWKSCFRPWRRVPV